MLSGTPFQEALAALRKPLAFAASDDFAHLPRLRDLEKGVAAAAGRAAALCIPPDAARVLTRIEEAFAAPLEVEAKRKAVTRALELLAPLEAPSFADAAIARPLGSLAGVGPRRAQQLAQRGLRSIADLLFHLPSRYDDRREKLRIGDLEVGRRASFEGEVMVSDFGPRRGRSRTFSAVLGDDSGVVTLKWFRGGDSIAGQVKKGVRLRATGDVRRYKFSKEVIHPEIDFLRDGEEGGAGAGEAIVPDYSVPEGIPPRTFRRWVASAVAQYSDLVPSTLPTQLAAERGLPPAPEALRRIHRPEADAEPEALRERRTAAHERLVLEELYLLEVGLALRHAERARERGIALDPGRPGVAAALAALPFELTAAQLRAWREIADDLAAPHPMNRLLQGDVGSGKTAVAALAAVVAAESGQQAALMAPTELLAEQHARTLRTLLAGVPSVRVALLTASIPRSEADAVRKQVAAGEIDLVVGTHALLQPTVRFARLALAVIDEQHRFGVRQRQALAGRGPGGAHPHALVMTATPIPRSLALTLYGDLDVSVIDALPPGRTPARTVLLREGEGARVVELVRETLARGEQVYVVYPLVEESEKIDLRAASEQAARIRAAFPDAEVDLVHGRLDAAARGLAMQRFARGESQILVSTTVIEVGVDVANATLMIVEHAERFGLAQLHQLRGRVGRGDRPGTCVLVARGSSEDSEARLLALLETTDGFAIADADLRIRGPGEFLGTRQHGRLPDLRFADLVRDARLVALAREVARRTVRDDPGLVRAPALARAVKLRWGERLSLVGVG
jgi:ATP-dependent DNA helicase RecG